jgi:hypothetical protein
LDTLKAVMMVFWMGTRKELPLVDKMVRTMVGKKVEQKVDMKEKRRGKKMVVM